MILLVDDDPVFLESAEQLLDIGRGILLASSAEQARDLMWSVGAEFSVVIVDLDLGGEGGLALIREMARIFPDLPVIAISGVQQRNVRESAKLLGAVETLTKPINMEWNAAIARARAKAAHG